MKNTDLIQLIRTFSHEEFKKFGEFLRSGYFNKLKNLVRLYEVLERYYPEFETDRYNLFSEVFPGEKYDDARLRVLMSRMLAISKQFLAYEIYRYDEESFMINESRAMFNKGQLKAFNKSVSNAEKLIEGKELRDERGIYKRYELTLLKNSVKGNYGLTEDDLREEEELLIIHAVVSILRTYVTLLNRGTVLELKDKTDRVKLIEPLIEEYKSNHLVKVYYGFYQVLKEPEREDLFEVCLGLLDISDSYFGVEEIFDLYVILLNYCVLRVGNPKYRQHKFTIYKTVLSKGYLPREGLNFPYVYFNNVVNSAIESGEYEWGWKFMEENKDKLEDDIRENLVYHCEAKLYYGEGEYDMALDSLSKMRNPDSVDVFFRLAIRDLQIKILYDMGHYENIYPAIDNYQHYLKKNKTLNEQVKSSYRTYLDNLKKLTDIESGAANKKNFEKEIATGEFVHKKWILEKAGEL